MDLTLCLGMSDAKRMGLDIDLTNVHEFRDWYKSFRDSYEYTHQNEYHQTFMDLSYLVTLNNKYNDINDEDIKYVTNIIDSSQKLYEQALKYMKYYENNIVVLTSELSYIQRVNGRFIDDMMDKYMKRDNTTKDDSLEYYHFCMNGKVKRFSERMPQLETQLFENSLHKMKHTQIMNRLIKMPSNHYTGGVHRPRKWFHTSEEILIHKKQLNLEYQQENIKRMNLIKSIVASEPGSELYVKYRTMPTSDFF